MSLGMEHNKYVPQRGRSSYNIETLICAPNRVYSQINIIPYTRSDYTN